VTVFLAEATDGLRRWIMQDLVYVLITIGFFLVSIAYVHFCERVK